MVVAFAAAVPSFGVAAARRRGSQSRVDFAPVGEAATVLPSKSSIEIEMIVVVEIQSRLVRG